MSAILVIKVSFDTENTEERTVNLQTFVNFYFAIAPLETFVINRD